MISSCALYNSLNYSICEVCNEGYVWIEDQKTCVEECPDEYTLRRQEKTCVLDEEKEMTAKKVEKSAYSFTVIVNLITIF